MYLAIDPQPTCARAWVAAANAVAAEGEGYNVVIDVTNPIEHADEDNAVIGLVDAFLRDHDQNPVVTVANTIFPQALYQKFGAPRFYEEYHKVFCKLTTEKLWGRYFERMTSVHKDGDEGFAPLQSLIDKIRKQKATGKCVKATHEISLYNPVPDRNRWRGGPCLSFLSFKVHAELGLMLTAVYRNQTYITRCLGNLIGLGRLLAFVANETDLTLGNLTCISTHAELDVGPGWGLGDARALISEASLLLDAVPSPTPVENESASC